MGSGRGMIRGGDLVGRVRWEWLVVMCRSWWGCADGRKESLGGQGQWGVPLAIKIVLNESQRNY